MAAVKTFGERIADALVEDGLLFRKQVEELMELQKREGTRLLKIIIDKQFVTEQDMAVSMGRVLNTPPVNLSRMGIPMEIAELLPRDICVTHKVMPVSRLENKLFLAMADPLNVLAIDDVRRITKLEVSPMIASEKAIIDKLHNLDTGKGGSMEDIINDAAKQAEDTADADGLETVKETTEQVNLDQLAASSEEAPVIKLANLILVQAIKDVSTGALYVSHALSPEVVQTYLAREELRTSPLSGREREVLQLIAEGKSMKEIASVLGISVKTVETHRMRLMGKLDIHETASLVRYAIRQGMIEA